MYLQRARTFGGDLRREAHWSRRIGHAYMKLGRLSAARRYFDTVLDFYETLSKSTKRSTVPFSVEVSLLLRNASSNKFVNSPPISISPDDVENSALFECVTCLICKSETDLWLGNAIECLSNVIAAIKLALRLQGPVSRGKRHGPSAELAKGFAILAVVISNVYNMQQLAKKCSSLAFRLAESLYDPCAIAELHTLAARKDIGYGDWASVDENCTEAVELFKTLNDCRGWEASTVLRADSQVLRGNFNRAKEVRNLYRQLILIVPQLSDQYYTAGPLHI